MRILIGSLFLLVRRLEFHFSASHLQIQISGPADLTWVVYTHSGGLTDRMWCYGDVRPWAWSARYSALI